MKKLGIILCIGALSSLLLSWGTFGHEHINRAAVFSLPEPLQRFFYNHIDFITQEASIPDLRKHTINDKAEGPRHFIDLENFGALDSLPKTLIEAKSKYDEKFLQQNGILPWYMEDLMVKLTKAFKEKKKTEILFLAADLGHY
ncbi:MAG: S1/P1 Nuclease, partial [Bacteroidetes bacterium]|nr:S1/P1 Nuclease [Bacteroidota bacterium]